MGLARENSLYKRLDRVRDHYVLTLSVESWNLLSKSSRMMMDFFLTLSEPATTNSFCNFHSVHGFQRMTSFYFNPVLHHQQHLQQRKRGILWLKFFLIVGLISSAIGLLGCEPRHITNLNLASLYFPVVLKASEQKVNIEWRNFHAPSCNRLRFSFQHTLPTDWLNYSFLYGAPCLKEKPLTKHAHRKWKKRQKERK